jgi:hypothetical protein
MFQTKVVEKIQTLILYDFFFSKGVVLCDNVGGYCTAGQDTDDSEYVTLTDFPLQQWLQEHASLLRFTNIACIVTCSVFHSG